jgi:hypothetical protein
MPAISDYGGESSAETLDPEPPVSRENSKEMDGDGESPASSERRPEEGSTSPALPPPPPRHSDVQFPDFHSLDVPVVMETPPRDNAHAQLKPALPEEDDLPEWPAVKDDAVPRDNSTEPMDRPAGGRHNGADVFSSNKQPLPAAVNGMNFDDDDDDDEEEEDDEEKNSLPKLHISEEDLNGNVPNRFSFPSEFLPPPEPLLLPPKKSTSDHYSPSPYCMTPPYEQQLPYHNNSRGSGRPADLGHGRRKGSGDYDVPRGAVMQQQQGRSCSLGSEDGSSGLPFSSTVTEASSPTGRDPESPPPPPLEDSSPYTYDPSFLHSPDADDPQDYERRMQNVKPDQDAIPI